VSKENVEIVRRSNEALNRGDVDGALIDVHPDVESDWSESRAADGGMVEPVIHGRDQLRARIEDLLDLWQASWEQEELLEVSDDQVLSVATVRFRGRDGIELSDRGARLWTFAGGKVVHMKFFPSKERALESLGLSVQAMSEENVEIVCRAIDAWNRRDIEALVALGDPESEYVNSPTAVEPGTRRGPDEISAVMRAQWDLLTDGRWEIDRIYDRGEEVIALGRVSRRMPGSDARLEDRVLVSWKIRSGKIVRTEVLGFGRDEVQTALEAAGLPD